MSANQTISKIFSDYLCCSALPKFCRICFYPNIVYEEINIDESEIREKFMKDYPNLRSMPQIFVDSKNIGGYRELIKLDESTLK